MQLGWPGYKVSSLITQQALNRMKFAGGFLTPKLIEHTQKPVNADGT